MSDRVFYDQFDCPFAGNLSDRLIQSLAWRSQLPNLSLSGSQRFFVVGAIALWFPNMAIAVAGIVFL
jgi:hypothetical protein